MSGALGPIYYITLKTFVMALGMGPSEKHILEPNVKHVLGVLEWSYVVPEKKFFFRMGFWFGVTPKT